MKASEIVEGEVYGLGDVRQGRTIPTSNRVRVIQKAINRYGVEKSNYHRVQYVDENGNPIPHEAIVGSRQLIPLAEVEEFQRIEREARELRERERQERQEYQTRIEAVIATRLNISPETVSVMVHGPYEPNGQENYRRFVVVVCRIDEDAVEEIYAGASVCEDCGENGGRELHPIEIQQEVHVFLCEECIDNRRMDHADAISDAEVEGHFDY